MDNLQKAFGILLGALVLAGLGAWAWRANRAPLPKGPGVETAVPPSAKVVVYYFRTNIRCVTCRKFESYTLAELESDFSKELKEGLLAFRMVNVEDPGNEHFIQDYGLKTKSLVLVAPGAKPRWKNLERIWDEVGSEAGYKRYIQTEIASFLAGAS